MEGTVFSTFFIVFRETLEAGLIVGIILTILARMKQKKYFPHVAASSLMAVIVSVFAGILLLSLTEHTKEEFEKIIEGGISIAACGVLTYMIFWMDRQSKRIRPEIETQLEGAITRKEYLTMITLPFLSIFREGAETVLFLHAVAINNSGMVSLTGGLIGFLLAAAIAALIFIFGKKIPLRPLFQVTGVFLLLIAAGLLAYGIHEFQEIGILPSAYAPLWDINHLLNEKSGMGALLKSLFGYNGNPSLLEVLGYSSYLILIVFFLRVKKPKLSSV